MKKNKYAGQVKKRREAETLNASEKNMLAKVEQDRTLRQSLYHPIRVKAPDIPVDELIDYLQENGIGDAKLYNRLHRGLIVYVKHWESGMDTTGVRMTGMKLTKRLRMCVKIT